MKSSAANQYPCRLPSASLVLFLPALLFFVLGTGTPALAGFEPSRNLPTFSITYHGMGYTRGRGYWQLEVVRKHGFFNVMSFEKLNLDREMSSILL
jgi:hypothetical protein